MEVHKLELGLGNTLDHSTVMNLLPTLNKTPPKNPLHINSLLLNIDIHS